jgi:hypothetical protein
MTRTHALIAGGVLAATAVASAIDTIKAVRLADGYNDTNRLTAPVVDPSRAPVLGITITGAYDKNAKIVRRGATSMFTRGPEYNLDKAVDLGAIFAEAVRSEAAAMGFTTAGAADAAWSIDGTIKDVYLESKQIPYGATLFYGYLVLDARVRQGTGAPEPVQMRFHSYFGGYNAGLGRRDEAESALANLLVESAQDLLSRLNRARFHAPPHAEIAALIGRIQPSGLNPEGPEMHRIGLSGAEGAAAAILKWLPGEPDENRRSALIDTLADLGSPEAISVLSSRYPAEDEDCRWYSLKAMDYIGGDSALALVRDRGTRDRDGGPRRLAERITRNPPQ